MPSPASKIDKPLYSDFKSFEAEFQYKDDQLYSMIFQRNKSKIKVSKEKFAIRNLEKIFNATFLISPKIGFHAMSLRDLSAATGLSMGGLYSSVTNKETIAIIVKDVVAVVCEDVVAISRQQQDPQLALKTLIQGYLYAATLMHPWFNFLYFETKNLPQKEQEESKSLELEQVDVLVNILNKLMPQLKDKRQVQLVATMALSMIQERYLKPWKYHEPQDSVDEYADDCLTLIYNAIGFQTD